MKMIKVIIAEDHVMVREGLKQLLQMEDDIQVIDEATDGLETVKKVMDNQPDILLLDINMPKMNGLEVLQNLRDRDIECRVLVLTIHKEIEYLEQAFNIGIDGYVLKDSDSDVLIKAIRTIMLGETYIQPNMSAKLFQKLNSKENKNYKQNELTKREFQVLKLITSGMLNKEIANALNISEKTVKNHVSNIFKKINVSDRTQAAVYAIKNNYVDIGKSS